MISIIMIVYETENYIEKALQSVVDQDYKDLEIIVVLGEEGKCKDRCEEICKSFAAKDDRIKLIFAPPKGPADARNKGLAAVTGDYLGFVDGDDYIEPDMFSSMLKNIEETGSDIAVCGRFYEFQNKTLKDEAAERKVYDSDAALKVTLDGGGFFLHCWDKLFSKKIYEGLYFDPKVRVEDRVIVDKLISKADKIVYDSTPKYHFRERFGSLSKGAGMIRKNVEANELMAEFLQKNHPKLKNECDRFMLYEYITAVQNSLVEETIDKKALKEYKAKVKEYSKGSNPLVSRSLKIKSIMAIYFTSLLGLYTKKRQANVKEELVRFP